MFHKDGKKFWMLLLPPLDEGQRFENFFEPLGAHEVPPHIHTVAHHEGEEHHDVNIEMSCDGEIDCWHEGRIAKENQTKREDGVFKHRAFGVLSRSERSSRL